MRTERTNNNYGGFHVTGLSHCDDQRDYWRVICRECSAPAVMTAHELDQSERGELSCSRCQGVECE